MTMKDTLFLIPARGGSKGLPRKNIMPLGGKPLIYYTIDAARGVVEDEKICVSTDDHEIASIVEDYGLKVPFIRPARLASDYASSRDVILHAIDFYEKTLGTTFSKVCLLQPTSPLRKSEHIFEAFELLSENIDMIVSVKEAKANPYFNLFEEDPHGYLRKSKSGNFFRRQDAPKVWEYNGAIYIIRTQSIKDFSFAEFSKIKKYCMDTNSSIDIDNELDFKIASFLIEPN